MSSFSGFTSAVWDQALVAYASCLGSLAWASRAMEEKKNEQEVTARMWLDGFCGPVPPPDPWWRIKTWRTLEQIKAQYHHTASILIMIKDAPKRIKESDNEGIVVEYLVTTDSGTAKEGFPWQ